MLGLGYVLYGRWLARQWGIDPSRETPAHTSYDGKDFVPANPAVLMGHHFSSIAGTGAINGPIQAAVYGWVPVFLWCVLGGIFFGAVHDFGALFASIRHNGGSIGEIIKDSMGITAQRLFIIFALAVLILIIASFTAVVAGTFVSVNPSAATYSSNSSAAATSSLFIAIALVFGFLVYRKNLKTGIASIIGIIGVIAIAFFGEKIGLHFSRAAWILIIWAYVVVASLLPVWILLQPRDYLSSFLLYAMMIIAVIAIVGGSFTGAATMEGPSFYGWKNPSGQPLFPFLFITVACGACSGFHSLISSGTSSKQINNEKNAQIIGYGSMLIESGLSVISLIAVMVVWSQTSAGGGEKFWMSAPPIVFAGGIATMFASFAGEKSYPVVFNLCSMAVSIFALTTLDSVTRLSRYLFAELITPTGKTRDELRGAASFFSSPAVSTLIIATTGCLMGFMGLSQIWSVFGSANQLLASIAMLAVCTWLGKIGKNNKMFYFPMTFMLYATLTALWITILNGYRMIITTGGAPWGTYFQMIWSAILIILAVTLSASAFKVLAKQMAFILFATLTALMMTIIIGYWTFITADSAPWGTYFLVISSVVLVSLVVILIGCAFALAKQAKKKA